MNSNNQLKALIVYASLTGNTEDIADILANYLEKLGVKTQVEECTQVYAQAFSEYDVCVVATYTYGSDGDLPEEIEDFYEDLEELDLTGKVYGVLGSGETLYDKFCQSVDDFDEQFKLTGAVRGSDVVKVDLDAEVQDIGNIERFAENLVKTAKGIRAGVAV